MNVAFDPWIPVVNLSGDRVLASIHDVLATGGNYADLAVRPHERVAVMRLLLCVAHAALDGPEAYDDWCGVPTRLPEAANAYLCKWRDAFELFHQTRPWLQVVDLSKRPDQPASLEEIADWTPVAKLNFALSSGNASTLFDHEGVNDDRPIPLCETVLSMVTFQCFSTCGLISQVYWNGHQTVKSAKDAPCVPASMIHALLRGDSLSSTLRLNLPTYEDLRQHYPNHEIGRPIWEQVPADYGDAAAIINATTSYLGRLIPLARFLRLHPFGKRMLLGGGLNYPSFEDGFPAEPSATVKVKSLDNTPTRALLSFDPSRALWRDLAAVVVKRQAGHPGGPLALNSLEEGQSCDLVVAALARASGKASIIDTAESIFHISTQLCTAEGRATYEHEVGIAEKLANRLGWAVESYRLELDGGWEGKLKGAGPNKGVLKAKLHAVATNHYWTVVEKNLGLLMAHVDALGTESITPTREVWRAMLFKSVCDAYTIACGQQTPRHRRAFAKGWQRLTAMKADEDADQTVSKEEDQ